jgi:fructokinase
MARSACRTAGADGGSWIANRGRESIVRPMRIGIDLGGTKIEALAIADDGRELARRRVQTPREDYEGTVRAMADLVRAIEAETSMQGTIGVGIPGAPSPTTGLVKNANSTWLLGRPLVRDLEAHLGRPVRAANDANCFVLSEVMDGAAAGADVVFGVILGTGVGAGIAVREHVLTGPNAIAGEWGHNPLPWREADEQPGPLCYCGRHSCIEAFLSGPALSADYAHASGRTLTAREIVARAASGEPDADAALSRYESRLARALAAVINLLDPDVIVLGGGMSNTPRLYERVPQLWVSYVFAAGARADCVKTRLTVAKHGASSGVRGAAWLWPGPRDY